MSMRRAAPLLAAGCAVLALVATRSGAAAKAQTAPSPHVTVVETTADLSRRLTALRGLTFSARRPPGVPVITIDDTVHAQQIVGVGGAISDSSACLIAKLPS